MEKGGDSLGNLKKEYNANGFLFNSRTTSGPGKHFIIFSEYEGSDQCLSIDS